MKCDIIIPVWNQLAYTRRCLESIRRHTDCPYRIIVIDNGSEKETKDYLDSIKGGDGELLVIANETNQGYIKAINQGLAAARSDYICLLNNDTVVSEGWLSRMISLAEGDKRIGMVNPLGNEGKKSKDLSQLAQISSALSAKRGEYLEVERCSGFCLLLKREVFEAVGYFDENFGLGYFEDSDYGERARQKGYLSVRALDSYVYHHIGTSFHEVEERQRLFERNKKLFWHKWGRTPQIIYPLSEILPSAEARSWRHIRTCHALARERCKVKSMVGKGFFYPVKELLSFYGLTRHTNLKFYSVLSWPSKGKWNLAFNLFCLLKIRHLIKKGKGDILLVRDLKLAFFLLKFKRYLKIPIIFEADETLSFTPEKIKRMKNYVYNNVQAIIAVGHSAQKELMEQFYPEAPIYPVPDGQRCSWPTRARKIIEVAKLTLGGKKSGW